MKISSHRLSFLYFAILCTTSLTLFAQTNSPATKLGQKKAFQAGAATINITPPTGTIMGSSYGITVSEGVHDSLYAKALVFEQGGVKAAFIALDLISLPHAVVARTRELIAQHTGIAAANVIMTATHVHAGPQMNPLFWKAVGGIPQQKSEAFVKNLPTLIAESVLSAEAQLQPVRVSVGTTQEDAVNFNRRFLMKGGSVKMNPGRLNPNSVRPVGPVDPQLSVVRFESMDAQPVAMLVNFALHVAVVGGSHFSADFPAKISDRLAEVYGKDMVTIFTNGTSGNINHIDVTQPNQLDAYQESARIGAILAADVLKAMPRLQAVDINALQVRTETVALPVPAVQPHEVQWAQEVIARFGKPSPPPFDDVVRAWRIFDLAEPDGGLSARHATTTTVPLTHEGRALESEVQVMALGDQLALVGFPGDAFVELGLAIKLHSPFPYTIVSEQSANGSISYVPNRRAFPEGGYEVNSARFAPGGGEKLVDTVVRVLVDIFPY